MNVSGSHPPKASRGLLQALLVLVGLLIGAPASAAYNKDFLYTNGWSNFDWYYPSGFEKMKSTLGTAGGTLRIRSSFVWDGVEGTLITGTEHALVAYTQGSQSGKYNSPYQSRRQTLFQYGAGAFVRNDGLSLELWSHPSDSLPDNGAVWTANSALGCGTISTTNNCSIPLISLSQALSNPPASYITPKGSFSLIKGRTYWVRVTLTGQGNGWVTLKGELFVDSTQSYNLMQVAQISFIRDQYLPLSSLLMGTVGRTPGTNNISYFAYDYF